MRVGVGAFEELCECAGQLFPARTGRDPQEIIETADVACEMRVTATCHRGDDLRVLDCEFCGDVGAEAYADEVDGGFYVDEAEELGEF